MSTEAIYTRGSNLTRMNGVPALGGYLARFAHHLLTGLDVARQRRQLLLLDERSLNDIDISRADAVGEANRDFWDIPEDQKSGH